MSIELHPRFTYEGRNNGVRPFKDHVRSCADQVDVCAVGGDKIGNALWRAREGGEVKALARAGSAVKTGVQFNRHLEFLA